MPMYEFLCGSCEKDFETIVSSAQAVDGVECPECGSNEGSQETIPVCQIHFGCCGVGLDLQRILGWRGRLRRHVFVPLIPRRLSSTFSPPDSRCILSGSFQGREIHVPRRASQRI